MTDQARAFKQVSLAEALRALYIDFEGEKDKPPVLLGVHRRGRGETPFVQQDVLDPAFASLGGPALSLRDVIEKVVQRAEHGDRRIVAWSEYDLRVVRTLAAEDAELVARFERRYVNGRAFAERWRNRVHGGDRPTSGRLADYLALIDYGVPELAAPGNVGETIRAMRPRLQRGASPTPTQVERWERLIQHNRHDCIGMRRVCLRAATDLEMALCGTGVGRGSGGDHIPVAREDY